MNREKKEKRTVEYTKMDKLTRFSSFMCLIYFLILYSYSGIASKFNFFWIAASFVLGLARTIRLFKTSKYKLLKLVYYGMVLLVSLGGVVFMIIQGFIATGYFAKEPNQPKYMVVLGAHVNTSGPSKVLKKRLDKAVEYAKKYPDIQIVVSGGQGGNEPSTEASVMKQYLVSHQIDSERIIEEDRSTSTTTNLEYSSKYISVDQQVLIVSNQFHLYRATQIAKKMGYKNVVGIGAKDDIILSIHNRVREFFGIIKDLVVRNMSLI